MFSYIITHCSQNNTKHKYRVLKRQTLSMLMLVLLVVTLL